MLLDELITSLYSLGVGTPGVTLYGGTVPASPVVATGIFLTGGTRDLGNPTRYPTFQVVHRNTHVASGTTFVTSLHGALDNAWNLLPQTKARIQALHEPGAYAYVGDRMFLFALNFRLTSFSI